MTQVGYLNQLTNCEQTGNSPEESPQALYAGLLHAEAERAAGYQGRTGDEAAAEMRQIISDAKQVSKKT